MKLAIKIYFPICILFVDLVYANSDIDELKRSSKKNISGIKNEFILIKNKIISPYNKKQFSHESLLDSLHFLSKRLDTIRRHMFSYLRALDLNSNDIQFFDKLNGDSILLYNIINGFGRIYYRYLSYDKINRGYSLEQFNLDIKKLIVLEKKLFLNTDKFSKK